MRRTFRIAIHLCVAIRLLLFDYLLVFLFLKAIKYLAFLLLEIISLVSNFLDNHVSGWGLETFRHVIT